MLSRRAILKSATAASVVAATPALVRAATADKSSGDLAKLFDIFVEENFDIAPEFVTSLGLDNGARAYQKFQLGERSPAAADLANDLAESQLTRLKAVNAASLSASDKLNVKIIGYGLDNQVTAAKKFKFAGGAAGTPYQINQLGGAYHDIPDFLDSQHQIETKDDAEAYLARLS
ncbi:MAG TPA: DUF885 family protein, partial [Magnetospirillaceae bacterium]|nr:DUF885 family protein [Magnetospirillaceae bacterium]